MIQTSEEHFEELTQMWHVARLAVRLVELRKDAATDRVVKEDRTVNPPTVGGASIARAESALAELERAVNRLPVAARREAMKNGKPALDHRTECGG